VKKTKAKSIYTVHHVIYLSTLASDVFMMFGGKNRWCLIVV